MKQSEIQRQHFNSIKEKYTSSRTGKNHLAYKKVWWDQLLHYLKNEIQLKQKMKCLEAMCGIGEGTKILKLNFPNMDFDGFDYSDEMVEECKKQNGTMMNVFHQDILKFHEQEQYDLIVLLGGLHHVPDFAGQAIQNLFSSLKHGGTFLNLEPTHNNFIFRKIRERIYKKNSLFEENTERGFELQEYNQLLIDNGFIIKKQFYPGLLGYVLYYNPDAFPFLNIGSKWIATLFSKIDWFLGKTVLGKYFSFATWTIAVKK